MTLLRAQDCTWLTCMCELMLITQLVWKVKGSMEPAKMTHVSSEVNNLKGAARLMLVAVACLSAIL